MDCSCSFVKMDSIKLKDFCIKVLAGIEDSRKQLEEELVLAQQKRLNKPPSGIFKYFDKQLNVSLEQAKKYLIQEYENSEYYFSSWYTLVNHGSWAYEQAKQLMISAKYADQVQVSTSVLSKLESWT